MVEAIQKTQTRLPEDPPSDMQTQPLISRKTSALRKTDSRSITTNVRNTRLARVSGMSPSETHIHLLNSIVDG